MSKRITEAWLRATIEEMAVVNAGLQEQVQRLRAEVERLREAVSVAPTRILTSPVTWASGDVMPDGHPYDARETCGCPGPAACRDRRARGECSWMVRAADE